MLTPRVLIVDDERDTTDLLARSLRRSGMTVSTASDGKEAQEMINVDADLDVLVTDLVMPELDGISLLATLPAETSSRLVKIVVTSFADKENVKGSLNAGADFLIEKPFTGAQLAGVIERLLDERQSKRVTPDMEAAVGDLFVARVRTLPLSEVERRIVSYIVKGASNATIARSLDLSEQTIKNRVSMIYRKLGISGRAELFHLIFPV